MSSRSENEKKALANELLNLMASRAAAGAPKPTGLQHYRPQPTDIIIATYPKAGTTLLQNMTYQIVVATGGAPPFDPDGTAFTDICQVAPWLEYGPEFGVTECPSNPRVFKTHEPAVVFDLSKSKFVFCVRNPLEFPGSRLDFMFDILTGGSHADEEVREQVFHEYVRRSFFGRQPSDGSEEDTEGSPSKRYGSWFGHTKSWTEETHPNVLVIFYEDVKRDLAATARRIASFMGRSLPESGLKTVVERCDRKRMASDSRFVSQITSRGLGLGDAKLRTVFPEDRKGFKDFVIEESSMEAYKESMQSTFGVSSYDEFCNLVHR